MGKVERQASDEQKAQAAAFRKLLTKAVKDLHGTQLAGLSTKYCLYEPIGVLRHKGRKTGNEEIDQQNILLPRFKSDYASFSTANCYIGYEEDASPEGKLLPVSDKHKRLLTHETWQRVFEKLKTQTSLKDNILVIDDEEANKRFEYKLGEFVFEKGTFYIEFLRGAVISTSLAKEDSHANEQSPAMKRHPIFN
ncbi:hypothetical protein [Leifsonia sp. NPDC080035]|uniref:Uncharacterized protein n=1 Tax=Leifsonia sp. NPDC080035 TaxID=3143936 RepID=A0AAU7GEE8_9MICO